MRRALALATCALLLAGCASAPPAARAPSSAAPSSAAAGSSSVAAPASSSTPAPAVSAPAALAVPVAVVVENAPGARPQSGLDQATIVWEILAEGFITRFLAIFTHASPQIGPVRSARIYFDQLDHVYGLPLAHAGGSPDGLAWIGTYGLQNLDQIYGSSAYFWRSAAREAPHNLYTSTALLQQAAAARGFRAAAPAGPPTGALPAGGTATAAVTLTYYNNPAIYTYIAGWNWTAAGWVRQVNGQVQTMTDGAQIVAGTVLILVVPDVPDDAEPPAEGLLRMLWNEGGTAYVLRDGVRFASTWSLSAAGLPTVAAPAGAGPDWYEVVPTASDIAFQ